MEDMSLGISFVAMAGRKGGVYRVEALGSRLMPIRVVWIVFMAFVQWS